MIPHGALPIEALGRASTPPGDRVEPASPGGTMSRNGKGSARRQETAQDRQAYAVGWDRVFGSKRGPPVDAAARGLGSGVGPRPGVRVERGVLDEHIDAEAAEQARDKERLKALREAEEPDDDRTPIMTQTLDDTTPTMGSRALVDDGDAIERIDAPPHPGEDIDPGEIPHPGARRVGHDVPDDELRPVVELPRPPRVESRTPNVYGRTTREMDEHGHYPTSTATPIPATGTCAHVYGSGKRCTKPVYGEKLCALHRDSL